MANAIGSILVELGLNSSTFQSSVDKASYSAKKLGADIRASMREASDSVRGLLDQFGGFGQVGSILNSLSSSFGAVSTSIKGLASNGATLQVLGGATLGMGAAAVTAAAGLYALGKSSAETIEQYNLLSQKTGIGIRDLQTLNAVAESVHLPVDEVAKASYRLSRAMAETGEKSSNAAAVLRSLGVTSKEPYGALVQFAEGISKIDDPSRRAADASAVLGVRIAQNLLPFLEKGRAGFEEYNSIVAEFGGTISKQGVAAEEAYVKSTVELSTAMEKLKLEGDGIIPSLTKINELMAEIVSHPVDKAVQGLSWYLTGNKDWMNTVAGIASPGSIDQKSIGGDYSKGIEKQANDDRIEQAKKRFEIVKAGSQAEYALQQQLAKISAEVAANDFEDARADQQKIPALQAAADLAKKMAEDQKKFMEGTSWRNLAATSREEERYDTEHKKATEEQQKKDEEAAELQMRLLNEIGQTFRKEAEERIQLNKQVHDSEAKVTGARQEADFSAQRSTIQRLAEANVISKQEEAKRILALDEAELQSFRKTHAEMLAERQFDLSNANAAVSPNDIESQKAAAQAQVAYNNAVTEGIRREEQLREAIAGAAAESKKLSESVPQGFVAGIQQFTSQFQGLGAEIQKVTTEDMGEFNNAIAQFITTGKGGFTKMLEGMTESLIKLGLQFIETTILRHFFDQQSNSEQTKGFSEAQIVRQAAIGQAAAEAATSAAWGGPAAAVEAAAITLAALEGITMLERGGDTQPGKAYIVGEKRPELFVPGVSGHVYPQVPTGGGGEGKTLQVSVTNAPSVNAIDAAGMQAVIAEHGRMIAEEVIKQARAANMI